MERLVVPAVERGSKAANTTCCEYNNGVTPSAKSTQEETILIDVSTAIPLAESIESETEEVFVRVNSRLAVGLLLLMFCIVG